MEETIFLEIEKLHFYKNQIKNIIAIIATFFLAGIFATYISNSTDYLWKPILTLTSVYLAFYILNIYFKPWIYIYFISESKSHYVIKWMENSKNIEATIEKDELKIEFVPYGKNNPYLKFTFKKDKKEKILKQFCVEDWNRKQMDSTLKHFSKQKSL